MWWLNECRPVGAHGPLLLRGHHGVARPSGGEARAQPQTECGFDPWVLAHRRQILLSVIVCNMVNTAAAWGRAPSSYHWNPLQIVLVSLYFGSMLLVGLVRGRRVAYGGLAFLLVLYALDLVVNVNGG